MENASKAMIIVAAMLISVMILSLMMYLFGQAARVPVAYEETKQEEMILEFNSKFEGYAKVADLNGDGKITDYKLVSSLTGSETSEINNPSNTFSEVISACNAAYDVNDRNGNDKKNSVIVDININGDEYSVVPVGNDKGESILKKDHIFVGTSTEVASKSISTLKSDSASINIYSLLDKVIYTSPHGDSYTLSSVREFDDATRKIYGLKYKYYFDGVTVYGEEEGFDNFGKITKLSFTLVPNELY